MDSISKRGSGVDGRHDRAVHVRSEAAEFRGSWVDPREAEYFLRITTGTDYKLALNLMPRQLPAETYFTRRMACTRPAHSTCSSGTRTIGTTTA